MTQKHTIFFDLDGTLTDPQEGIVGCIRYALDRLGVPQPADERLTACIGPPLLESFIELVGEPDATRAVEFYRQRFGDFGWQENRRYPGIIAGLKRLKAANFTLFVATSKPAIFAERIISHFNLSPYFDQIFGSELDGTRANKVDLLRHALGIAIPKGLASNKITMVGDRKHDVIGAKANAMRSVGVTYGFGSRHEHESAGADEIVDSVAQLMDFLSGVSQDSKKHG